MTNQTPESVIAEVIEYHADTIGSHYYGCYKHHAVCLAVKLRDMLREPGERDAALSTIAKVEALHTSEGWPLPGGRESKEYCTRCNCRWPCPTIRALGSVPSTGEGNE